MGDSKKYFYVCAIGPVQDFIASARTSHDLQFGSWLLSELSKAAARSISIESHQLIFPAPRQKQDLEPGSTLSVANKVVAIVGNTPEDVADQVWQAVTQRLNQVYKETYDKINGNIDRELAQKQINDLIEFYWVSVPYIGEQRYTRVRSYAEALLAARKTTRNFRQTTGREGVPKSSLDGFRESVLRISTKPISDDEFYTTYHAESGEALSGIDLLKRWGEAESASFSSTTDVAAQPFRLMLKEEKEQVLLQRVKALLKAYTDRGETDGTYFYVERLVQLIEEEDERSEFRDKFAQILKEEGIDQRPSPYYTLLLADGDNMGKTIDAQDDEEKHQKLSRKLSTFAQVAKDIIVDEFGGTTIYVGGDDILAYLPLHTALACISSLNAKFKQDMQDFLVDESSHSATLSGGLVIAHHLTPLSDVLNMAHRVEKQAKGISGKNALAIVANKRGGVSRIVKAKLDVLIERMQVLIGYTRQGQISAGTAYELQKLHQELSETKLTQNAFQREAIRIIQRKRETGGEQEIQKEVQQRFEAWFEDETLSLNELALEMIIAGEFAGAYEMAGIPSGPKEAQA